MPPRRGVPWPGSPARSDGGRWFADLVPVTVDDVRVVARPLPRAYEVVVHDRVKFRVGQIVWLAFSLFAPWYYGL